MKRTFYSIGVIVLILAVLGVLAFFLTRPPTSVYSDTDPGYNQKYWREVISYRGAANAYHEFEKRNTQAPKNRQHFAAHVIGTLLYEKLGFSGVTVCSDSFAFGCYHGLSSGAISEGGKRAIRELALVCAGRSESVTDCYHGIGHGILEYAGYNNLEEALLLCESLIPHPGCTSGVFMEYFTPLSGGVPVQLEHYRFDPEKPYTPCPDVVDRFKKVCYFELGQALRQTEGSNYFSLCGRLTGEEERHDCFLGVGTDLARIPDPADVLTRCKTLAPEDELYCRAGAAWGYADDTLERSSFMCGYEDEEDRAACAQASNLGDDLGSLLKRSVP